MNLTELKMWCFATECVDATAFGVVIETLDVIVDRWDRQQRDLEQKKLDDEALYVTK